MAILRHPSPTIFLQFCQTDIFGSSKHSKRVKYARDYRNFNKHEFSEELLTIDWPDVVNEIAGTEISYQRFFNKLEEILNFMAPYRKMTQKEIRLKKDPMRVCDNLREQIAGKQDSVVKTDVSRLYKRYRNLIVNLQRASKTNYYISFFQENYGNVKKNVGRYTVINKCI